jgi:endonuclease VIII-like 1
MPEISEIRIMSEQINTISDISCSGFWKRPEHKSKTAVSALSPEGTYKISASSRGKELKVDFSHIPNHSLCFMMGMGGNWGVSETPAKHAHLVFKLTDGRSLYMEDVRRFARWVWRKKGEWDPNRGPDPVKEHDAFVAKVKSSLGKKEFNKPIFEVLMNQEYFNGIGNYLRAEILARIDKTPFTPACTFIEEKGDELFTLCKRLPEEAYILGGGQLRDWENPFKMESHSFAEWLQCYDRTSSYRMKDKTGRTFWFLPKWVPN